MFNIKKVYADLVSSGDALYGRIPANTKHLYNICTASAQRLRRWSNIVQMLYKCFVFTGILWVDIIKVNPQLFLRM